MLRQERLHRICDLIEANGQATVVGLSHELGVSQMTIRRDLQELDAHGFVRRIHGGALPPERQRNRMEPPVLERVQENAEAKRALGKAAADLIVEGEAVFLGSGTTTLAVAAELAAGPKHLTVFTNALTIANALASVPEITLVVVGGFLRRSEFSLVGHLAEAAVRGIRVDRVIMGMRGIDPEQGLTSDYIQELKTDQAILGMGGSVIIVADHTKFGHIATSRTAPVEAASLIITDVQAPGPMVEAIRARGVEVVLVGDTAEGAERA
jgi:DeoR/GlpR family transcriptional regulator of sugar metabolism